MFLSQAIGFLVGCINLFIRLIWIPFSILAAAWQVIGNWKVFVVLLGLGGIGFLAVNYVPPIAAAALNLVQTHLGFYYDNIVKPIIGGIIQIFFDNVVCYYNAFFWYPYGVIRNVIYPILRQGGLATIMKNFVLFLRALSQDVLLDWFYNGNFFSNPINFARSNAAWQTVWRSWQYLVCYGCEDTCLFFTNVPLVPASNQYGSQEWLNFLDDSVNGWVYAGQQVIYLVFRAAFPSSAIATQQRPGFQPAFDYWCAAGTNLRISFENSLQQTWDTFLPFLQFQWTGVLSIFDNMWCIMMQFLSLIVQILTNSDLVLQSFNGQNNPYWSTQVRWGYEGIINRIAPAAYFNPIIVPVVNTSITCTITTYQLLNTEQSTPWGAPNPVFNQTTSAGALCLGLTRIFCDPQNNGTTCAQQFNGTLLADFDICCMTNEIATFTVNFMAMLFEPTLHTDSAQDFIVMLNNQPFTQQLTLNAVDALGCLFGIFKVIQVYGYCISQVLYEFTLFIASIGELLFRVVIALITLPYYEKYMPGMCNLISCPDSPALNQSLAFIDRIVDPTNPNGFVNCFCLLTNQAFQVPYANCTQVPCVPVGYVQPNPPSRRFPASGFTPIMLYGNQKTFGVPTDWADVRAANFALKDAAFRLSNQLKHVKVPEARCSARSHGTFVSKNTPVSRDTFVFRDSSVSHGTFALKDSSVSCADDRSARFAARSIITQAPVQTIFNCTDPLNPPPCFNLCCFPTSLFELIAQLLTFTFRSLNALANSRNGTGSAYFDGTACAVGLPCLASDLTNTVIALTKPLTCLCQLLLLVIPPNAGIPDPCCFFTIAGDIVSGFFQIIINIANSIASDAPNYTYITNPAYLAADFQTLLQLGLQLFDCACNFVTVIFDFAVSGITKVQKNFNICCTFRAYFKAGLAAANLLFRLILSISTLEDMNSQCYLYLQSTFRPNCVVAVSDLPIMQDFYLITAALLQPPPDSYSNLCSVTTDIQLQDTNNWGLAPCFCNLVNALMAAVFKFIGHQGIIDNSTNPQCVLNICCFFFKLSQMYQALINFIAQGIASLWQNWQYRQIVIGGFLITPHTESFYVPQATLDFVFCNEYPLNDVLNGVFNDIFYNTPTAGNVGPLNNNSCLNAAVCPHPSGQPGIINPNGDFYDPATQLAKCGKFEPVLQALNALLGSCMCSSGGNGTANQQNFYSTCGLTNPYANGLANVLDALLRWILAWVTSNSQFFPFQIVWPECLCCGGPNTSPVQGILKPLSTFIVVYIRQIVMLIRNLPNPSYWSGENISLTANLNTGITQLADNVADIRKTWINRFLAPIADSLTNAITNAGCLLAMVLGNTCDQQRYTLISSFVRYYLEAIIHLVALIEGAVKLLAQELPGQCVANSEANAGNVNQPASQGSTGNYQLIPTCSPHGAQISYAGGLDGNQLGRIIVSILTFVADALIGIGRLGCSQVCPGLGSTLPSVNLVQAQTCSCYNLTPYIGVGGGLCSYPTCQSLFNSGASGEFVCPTNPNATYCSLNDSILPPNTGTSAFVSLYGDAITFATRTGHCLQGCSNASDVVQAGEEWIPGNNSIWVALFPTYPFVPVLDATQPSGLHCEIVNNPPSQVQSKAAQYFGKNLQIGVSVPTFPNSWCYTDAVNPSIPVNTAEQKWRCQPTASYIQNLLTNGQTYADNACNWCLARATSPANVYLLNSYQNATLQPVCDRDWCVSKGWCKNDQLVGTYPGGPILDGIIISAFKYLRCLLNDIFGPFMGTVFDGLLTALSFIWQLSGGIIRFAVDIFVIVFNFLTRIPFVNLFLAIPDLLSLFGDFFAIFTQPVVFTFRGISLNSMESANQDRMRRHFEYFFGYDDAHDCVNAPELAVCLCRVLNMSDYCHVDPHTNNLSPQGLTTNALLEHVAEYFGGSTACDVLFQQLANEKISNWVRDVSYARRHAAVQCIQLRAQGERWNEATGSTVPSSFFYNTRGFILIYDHIVGNIKRYVREDHMFHVEQRKKRSEEFQKRFGRDFYRQINSRGAALKQFYEKEHGITEHSPVLWPLMKLDMYHFKYRAGYYHYLVERMAWRDGTSLFGSLAENLADLHEAIDQIKQSYNNARPAFSELGALWNRLDVRSLRFSWPVKAMSIPVPPTPPVLKHLSWEMVRSVLPALNPIQVRVGWPEFKSLGLERLWPRRAIWTDELEQRWNTGWGLVYSAAHWIWPYWTTKDHHERFILNGNCRLVDGAVNLGITVFDYCLAQTAKNYNLSSVQRYHERTSYLRRDSFFRKWDGKYEWKGERFLRPKVLDGAPVGVGGPSGRQQTLTNGANGPNGPNGPNGSNGALGHSGADDHSVPWDNVIVVSASRQPQSRIDPRSYRRAVLTNPGGFVGIIISWIDSIFGINLVQILNNFITSFNNWVNNDNLDPSSGTKGGLYWLTFFVRCEFPDNLNCSQGIGLGPALVQVGLVFLIIIAVLIVFFPSLLSLLSSFVLFLAFILSIGVVAWHYSPACFFLFPSIQVQPDVSIPVIPLPLPVLPLLPECIWDQIVDLLDQIFAACYTWIPQCLLNGDQCGNIAFPSCYDVGIYNPYDVLLYWGYMIFGSSFCSVMRGLSTNVVGGWIPGFRDATKSICFELLSASDTQACRQLACGALGIAQIGVAIAVFYVIAIFAIAVIPALINAFHAVLLLLQYLPFYEAAVGMGEPTGSFVLDGEEPVEVAPPAPAPQTALLSSAVATLERWVKTAPKRKTE